MKGPSHTELERIIWWPHSFHVMAHTHPYDLLHDKIRRHHCAFALESTENLCCSLSQRLRLICPSVVCVTPGSHGTEIVGVMRSCDLGQPIHWILHLLTNCTLLLLSNDSVSWGCTCFFWFFNTNWKWQEGFCQTRTWGQFWSVLWNQMLYSLLKLRELFNTDVYRYWTYLLLTFIFQKFKLLYIS